MPVFIVSIFGHLNLICRTFRLRDIVKSKDKRNVGANAMRRVAAGAHLPTLWLFEFANSNEMILA